MTEEQAKPNSAPACAVLVDAEEVEDLVVEAAESVETVVPAEDKEDLAIHSINGTAGRFVRLI